MQPHIEHPYNLNPLLPSSSLHCPPVTAFQPREMPHNTAVTATMLTITCFAVLSVVIAGLVMYYRRRQALAGKGKKKKEKGEKSKKKKKKGKGEVEEPLAASALVKTKSKIGACG